jgi:hypothetical protein
LETSAKNGENCSDQANAGKPSNLKRLIADSIPWDKLPWTPTPQVLAELKNAVMKMRDAADIRLLRFAELAQRLEQALPGEKFGESDVRTAVALLANHGLAGPLKFGDLVLLQPELLNGYAGAIIRSARAHRDEIGSVQEADVYRPDFDFTGVDRLPRADEELLLRALVQTLLDHSLCIAEDTPQGRQLVFPSQYRREKDIPWEPDVFVSYTFGGEWQTIWTTLVVRLWYSQEFEHKELWRNAAEFKSSKGDLLGLKIDNRQGEGEATISLFFDLPTPDELKVIFIEYVHPPPGAVRLRGAARPAVCLQGVPDADQGSRCSAQAIRGRQGFHYLPNLRRAGGIDRLHRAAAEERPGGPENLHDGRNRHAATRRAGVGADSVRPCAGDRGRGQPDFPARCRVRLRHRRRNRVQG